MGGRLLLLADVASYHTVLLIYLLYLPPPPLPQVGGRLRVLAEEQPLLLTWLKEEQGTSQRLAVRLRAASEDAAAKEREMQVCVREQIHWRS